MKTKTHDGRLRNKIYKTTLITVGVDLYKIVFYYKGDMS